jgi:hypothetical protein
MSSIANACGVDHGKGCGIEIGMSRSNAVEDGGYGFTRIGPATAFAFDSPVLSGEPASTETAVGPSLFSIAFSSVRCYSDGGRGLIYGFRFSVGTWLLATTVKSAKGESVFTNLSPLWPRPEGFFNGPDRLERVLLYECLAHFTGSHAGSRWFGRRVGPSSHLYRAEAA